MLFSGLACFSPLVPRSIRQLWVNNGGALTHTEADFRKAQFFFCYGMDDPWLNELLSRSLIVRHACWVTLCVIEDFIMPIAEYTLDAGFDEARIRILEPPISISIVTEAHKSVRAQRETARKVSPLEPPLLPLDRDCDSAVAPAAPANQRKRRLGNEDSPLAQHAHDVHVLEVERPTKKVKIKRDAHDDEPVRISDVDEPILVAVGSPSAPQKHSKSDILAEESGGVPVLESGAKHVYFHHPKLGRRQAEAVAKSKHAFKKCIVRTENTTTSTTQPKKAGARSTHPLNPHTLFWNDIFAKSFPRTGTALLKVSVRDLVHAPRTKGVIFDVNKSYLGKPFINLEIENDEKHNNATH